MRSTRRTFLGMLGALAAATGLPFRSRAEKKTSSEIVDPIYCDASAGDITLSLPRAMNGQALLIVNSGPRGKVTISPNCIDGLWPGESVLLKNTDKGWEIMPTE